MSKCLLSNTLTCNEKPRSGASPEKVPYPKITSTVGGRKSGLESPSADRNPDPLPYGLRLVRLACLGGSAALSMLVICSILLRFPTHFDNEWVESSITQSAIRVSEGKPLYGPPTAEYVPDNYPPLFFWLAGALIHVFGPSALTVRTISIVATVMCAAAIGRLATRSSASGMEAAIVCVGLFLGFYALGGEAYDLARVDMLALAFVLTATSVGVRFVENDADTSQRRRAKIPLKVILVGLLMAAAILAKHNMVMWAGTLGVALLVIRPQYGFWYGSVAAGIPLLAFTILHNTSDGWSTYFLFTQPSMHPFGGENRILRFVINDVGALGFTFAGNLLIGAIYCHSALRMQNERRAFLLLALSLVGALAVTLVGRLKAGGFANNLVPVWAMGVMMLAWMLPRLSDYFREQDVKAARTFSIAFWSVACLLFVMLGNKSSGLFRDIGSDSQRKASIAALNGFLSEEPTNGLIWVPAHNVHAGSIHTFAHLCPVGFLMDSPKFAAKSLFEADVAQQLEARRWSTIILDGAKDHFISDRCTRLLHANYEERPWPLADPACADMLTGKKTYPQRLFKARR